MSKDINEALTAVEMSYQNVIDIANDMLADYLGPTNEIIQEITENANSYSIDELRSYILKLQLQAFSLSEIKEKSTMKADIAEFLRKEKYAQSYNGASGTSGVKDNIALLESSEEAVTQCLYNLVSNLMKSKLDQIHRMVDALKSILMSRMQEAKLMAQGSTDVDLPMPKMILNE